jgi:hypothetical protein
MCLGIGLVLRDLRIKQFESGEDDDDEDGEGDLLVWNVKHSKLDWGHTEALGMICKDIMDDIALCFAEEEVEKPLKPTKPPPKPSSSILPKLPGVTTRTAAKAAAAAAEAYVIIYCSVFQ